MRAWPQTDTGLPAQLGIPVLLIRDHIIFVAPTPAVLTHALDVEERLAEKDQAAHQTNDRETFEAEKV